MPRQRLLTLAKPLVYNRVDNPLSATQLDTPGLGVAVGVLWIMSPSIGTTPVLPHTFWCFHLLSRAPPVLV